MRRVAKLKGNALNGTISQSQLEEYERIDNIITKSMLAVQNELPTREGDFWTAEFKKISMSIRYYHMLLKWCNSITFDKEELDQIGVITEISYKPKDVKELLSLLKKEWSKLVEYKKEGESKRGKFMAQYLKDSIRENDDLCTEDIAEIKKREQSRWRFRRIKKVLKKVHGAGLMAIDLPNP